MKGDIVRIGDTLLVIDNNRLGVSVAANAGGI